MSTVVPDTRTLRSTDRMLALPATASQRPRAALAVVLGFAAVVFLAGLGRSSLFIDEIFSWNASSNGLSGIDAALHNAEVTPPLYYLGLHAWIGLTGADSELMLRLPSALAGVGLVAAIWWLGTIVGDRRSGLLAGLLAALSPLVFQYAQEMRAYVFVMLAVTLAAGAAVRLAEEPERRRWLVLAMGASVTAVMLHYTAVLALGPLSLWLFFQRQVGLRARLAFGASAAVPFLALVPLMLTQMAAGHHNVEADAYARITPLALLKLFSTPFDGRALEGVSLSYELGFLALVDALALLAFADRFRALKTRWLLVGASVVPVAAIVSVSALAHPLALTRYTAVAVPFMLVAVAVVVQRVPRALGVGLAALALIAGAYGVVMAQTPGGQWPDVRSAIEMTADRWRPGDVVVGLNNLAFPGAMNFYDRDLPASAPGSRGFYSTSDAFRSRAVRQALARGDRVWVLASPAIDPSELAAAAAKRRATVRSERQFGGAYPVQLTKVTP